jgi:hypothetical protein
MEMELFVNETEKEEKDRLYPVGHEKAGRLADFRDKTIPEAVTEENLAEYLNWLMSQG